HAALLGLHAWACAGGIYKGDDREAESSGVLHQPLGLAVALRLGHPEVARDVLFGRAALLLAYDHDRLPLKGGKPPDDGRIVPEEPVAMQLHKIGAEPLDVIERMRAVGVARYLHALPGKYLGLRRFLDHDLGLMADARRHHLPVRCGGRFVVAVGRVFWHGIVLRTAYCLFYVLRFTRSSFVFRHALSSPSSLLIVERRSRRGVTMSSMPCFIRN